MNNTKNNKIGIIGLGPVGMILAVHLKGAGVDVLLCDNDKIKTNQIRNEGIKLEGIIEQKAKFSTICSSASELLKY